MQQLTTELKSLEPMSHNYNLALANALFTVCNWTEKKLSEEQRKYIRTLEKLERKHINKPFSGYWGVDNWAIDLSRVSKDIRRFIDGVLGWIGEDGISTVSGIYTTGSIHKVEFYISVNKYVDLLHKMDYANFLLKGEAAC